MKAWVLHDIGDIRFEDIDKPKPGTREVLVRVKSAGICGSDIPRTFDTGSHRMPLILGHEFSGEVVETGKGADASWSGKRVGIFPLIPCRKCEQCINERYELCRNYDYLGSRSNGAFAEYVTVPADNLIELPDNASFEEAAMLEPMAVAVHAIRRVLNIGVNRMTDNGKVPDEFTGSGTAGCPDLSIRIAVLGLGTIGMFITMFLKAAGYNNLYLIGNKESQKKNILALGIPEDCYYDNLRTETDNQGREKTDCRNMDHIKNSGGADVVFECVGRTQTYADAIDIAAPMGKIMLVGNPYSDMTLPRNTYWKILRNQLTVKGTWNSSFTGSPDDDWHYVLSLIKDGIINPGQFISHRFPLADLKKGLYIMHNKSEEYGKIMISSLENILTT